jgi:hypothetical protein
MPDVSRFMRVVASVVLASAFALPLPAQQDSTTVRDSVMRADSIRADSVRADSIRRSELARIRAEPRATAGVRTPELRGLTQDETGTIASPPRLAISAASVAGDMTADLSPKALARGNGGSIPNRILLRDIEGALSAKYGSRLSAVVAITLADDGSSQRLRATDAAIMGKIPFGATLVVGHTALPFGRVAQLHRHELLFPDQPLPSRVLLGDNGLRGTGLQLRMGHDVHASHLSLDLAVADRFGARVDSLHPGEPADQSVAGLAAGGRIGAAFTALGARLDIGASSITGKREQPIGCVYDGTVGPVPCPQAVNAANTRLTVVGADGSAAWAVDAFRVSAEWMRMIVGTTDMPVFINDAFAPFYRGLIGTYDGGYVSARARISQTLGIGARGEWLQNPEVGGLNDAWAGGYVDVAPVMGARVAVSYQRRLPSTNALATMTPAAQLARDRIVVRGTIVIGRHPSVERD